MTSKRRKLLNRRSCFLFRIEACEKLSGSTLIKMPKLVVMEPPHEALLSKRTRLSSN
jgi:hypothetical protein